MNARALFDSLPAAAKELNRHLLGEEVQKAVAVPQVVKMASRVSGAKGPNKTEGRYRAERIDRRDDVAAVHYEGLTLRMANGHRYTPDWVVVTKAGGIECHEVKGGYALGSEQRAKLAFDQARVEFPWIVWVWARRENSGLWTVSSRQIEE